MDDIWSRIRPTVPLRDSSHSCHLTLSFIDVVVGFPRTLRTVSFFYVTTEPLPLLNLRRNDHLPFFTESSRGVNENPVRTTLVCFDFPLSPFLTRIGTPVPETRANQGSWILYDLLV